MANFFQYGDLPFAEVRQKGYVRFLDGLFYLLLLSTPFSSTFFDRTTGEGAFLALLFIIFIVLSLPVWNKYYRHWHPVLIMYGIFLFIGFCSDLRAVNYHCSLSLLHMIRQQAQGEFLCLVAYNMILRNPRSIKKLVFTIVFCAIITGLFMVLGIGVATSVERGTEGYRYAVLGQNSNGTGRMLILHILLAFMLIMNAFKVSRFEKIMMIVLLPVSLLALVRTASRGSLATLVLVAPFVLLTFKSTGKKIVCVFAGLLAMGVLMVFILSSEMMLSRLQKSYYDRDMGGRDYIWESCIRIWSKNKFMGAGLVSYTVENALELGAYRMHVSSHNTYIRALVGAGLFGSAFYVGCLIILLVEAFKQRKDPYGNILFLFLIHSMICGITINIEQAHWLYVVWASIMGFDRLSKLKRPRILINGRI